MGRSHYSKWFGLKFPPPEKQSEADQQNWRADKLRRGKQAGVDVVGGIIAAKNFHDKPAKCIADEVASKNLTVEFFTAEQPR